MKRYREYERNDCEKIPRSTMYYREITGLSSRLAIDDNNRDDEKWQNCNIDDLLTLDSSDEECYVNVHNVEDNIVLNQYDKDESNNTLASTSSSHYNEPSIISNEDSTCNIDDFGQVQNQSYSHQGSSLHNLEESFAESLQNHWQEDIAEYLDESDYEDCVINEDSDNRNENYSLQDLLNLSSEDNFFTFLVESLQTDDYNIVVNKPLTATKAEMLFAVLQFSKAYNLPLSGIADLSKMINSFFGVCVLPDTRYLVDKLFNCKSTVQYHAVCSHCKKYIKKFSEEDRFVVCNVCETRISLKSPTYTDFFGIINVNNQIINVLEQNGSHLTSVIRKRRNDHCDEIITDFTDGLQYKKFMNSIPDADKDNVLTATFNSDGAPLFESSTFSIWPIQLIINELPAHVKIAKTFVCGIWFGKDKPNMNILFWPLVSYMNELATDGIKCTIDDRERVMKIFTLCCCVDSVARAPMQGIHQFNGHYGCSWCLHPGLYIRYNKGGSMKYIVLDDALAPRKERDTVQHMQQSIISRTPVYGVKHPSVLLLLKNFNIISGFVPDSMHRINLGIAKQFLSYWIDTTNLPYSFNKTDVDKINLILKSIKVPNQIVRYSRTLADQSWWNAREWENWVLFYSLPILKCFPHFKIYFDHWELLVKAYYVLLKSSITYDELKEAHELLRKFVILTESYYSKTAMTYNVHQLLHLTQSVVNWGPLWAHSGYCFENGNGLLLQKVHAAKGVVHQICRSVSMEQCDLILRRHVEDKNPESSILHFKSYLNCKECKGTLKANNIRYFGKVYSTSRHWIEHLQLSNNCRTYRKIVKGRCLLTSFRKSRLRSNNSFVVTSEGLYLRLMDFIIDLHSEKEYTVGNIVNVEDSTCFTKKIINVRETLIAVETDKIERVCIFIDAEDDQYICAIPNLYYY